jgi:thioredoxin 1
MKILDNQSFDDFIHNEKVIVTFSASWCGPCKMMAPLLEKVESSNEGRVAKVDVDSSSDLAAKYSIKSIPTTLVFVKGVLESKKVGLLKEDEIKALLN